jgi:cytochrome c oxidase assembly protein subunit 15
MDALINLNPALDVALLGALIALCPAALVAWRARRAGVRGWPAWQRVLTVATLFLTVDLVVFGAFTRLTDSGLGCPDWPGCYGQTSPFQAHAQISAAFDALPSGPVSHGKAWIEMLHRYLATAVGALITALMVLAWGLRHRPGALSPWWATATFVWVCAQGAFGALTVTLKLQPVIVTGHLLGAMLGVGLLTAQVRALDAPVPNTQRGLAPHRGWGMAVLALLTVQLALGAWVSTNYAVLACTEWPLCQGKWWPAMDFSMGFHLMRALGEDGQGGYITLAALTAIHTAHRLMALVVVLALWAYGATLRRHELWRREGLALWGLAAWQVLSGLSNVVLGWPLAAALAHTLGAALLVACLVRVLVCPAAWRAARAEARIGPASKGLHAGAHAPSTS